ncbi:hypothetical protein FACS1894211_11670 [Clostridia bacterium]|nr:hypothetical protein FACS1894211_11670 [Clostridia bacterium]
MKRARFLLCVFIIAGSFLAASCGSKDSGGKATQVTYPVYAAQYNDAQTELTVTEYKADKTTEKTVYQIYGETFIKGIPASGVYSVLPAEYQTKAQADAAVAGAQSAFDSNRQAVAGGYQINMGVGDFAIQKIFTDGTYTNTAYVLYGEEWIVRERAGTWCRVSATSVKFDQSSASDISSLPAKMDFAAADTLIEEKYQLFLAHHNEVVGAYKTESTKAGYTAHTVYRFNADNTYSVISYYLYGQNWTADEAAGTWSRTSATNLTLKKTGSSVTSNYTLNLANKLSFDAIESWIADNHQLYLDRYNSDPLAGPWIRTTSTSRDWQNSDRITERIYSVLTFNFDGTYSDIRYSIKYNVDGYTVTSTSTAYTWDRRNETEYDYRIGYLIGKEKMTRNGDSLTIINAGGSGSDSVYSRLAESLNDYFATELAAIRATWE